MGHPNEPRRFGVRWSASIGTTLSLLVRLFSRQKRTRP